MTTTDQFTWSSQQQLALREVTEWLKEKSGPQVYYLAGYAGTGKTTLARYLAEKVTSGPVHFAAYTGKAASVLRKMGCPGACTIHSLAYQISSHDTTALDRARKNLHNSESEDEQLLWAREVEEQEAKMRQPLFLKNDDSRLTSASLLVLDECSMVNETQGRDILSFGIKVLVLGDPMQLPPVAGGGFFTKRKPNLTLTEIHRQAADNPIIHLSQLVRNGETIPYGSWGEGAARKIPKAQMTESQIASYNGQILTGKNKTRMDLNRIVRRLSLGQPSVFPQAGERLVCLRNMHRLGLLNGVTCTTLVPASYEEGILTLSLDYEGMIMSGVLAHPGPFLSYSKEESEPSSYDYMAYDQRTPFDYGYCLTVHKAQGSQWDNVMIVDDGFMKKDSDTRQRWLYTAITRASNQLVILA